jgi:hypothetical protein
MIGYHRRMATRRSSRSSRGDGPLKSYHFSFGNSTDGPVGFCARVRAKSRAEAARLLRKAMPPSQKVTVLNTRGIEYVEAYFNPDALTTKGIDEEPEDV